MENTKAVVNLDIDKQFFEITEGLVNFEVDFEVQTDNDAPFEIAIVDQQTLDSDQFPYRRIDEGHVKGKVTNDNNKRVPFFMVLKADGPTRAQVSLQKLSMPLVDEIPKTPIFKTSPLRKSQKTGISEKFSTFTKNKNLILAFVVVAIVAVWWFKRRQTRSTTTTTPPQLSQSVASSPLSLIASPNNTNFGF